MTDATKSRGERESRKRSRSVPREDNLTLRPTINVYFLRRWPDALGPSENSIQSHMVSYCSAIKFQILGKSICDGINDGQFLLKI